MKNNGNDRLKIKAVILLEGEVDDFHDPAIQKAVNDAEVVYRRHDNNEEKFVPIHPVTRKDLVDVDTGKVLIDQTEYDSITYGSSKDVNKIGVVHIDELIQTSDMHSYWREYLSRKKECENT